MAFKPKENKVHQYNNDLIGLHKKIKVLPSIYPKILPMQLRDYDPENIFLLHVEWFL